MTPINLDIFAFKTLSSVSVYLFTAGFSLFYAICAALGAGVFDVSLQSCAFGWLRIHPILGWWESLQPE